MTNELEAAEQFCELLLRQARRKAALYDGTSRQFAPDAALRLATEELGEIASAITRERTEAARAECIDLAHCCIHIWRALGETPA